MTLLLKCRAIRVQSECVYRGENCPAYNHFALLLVMRRDNGSRRPGAACHRDLEPFSFTHVDEMVSIDIGVAPAMAGVDLPTTHRLSH